jgi:FAD/FMN-containing dehydrogenase
MAAMVAVAALPKAISANQKWNRVRPSDPDWPSADEWDILRQRVGGRLLPLRSPLDRCAGAAAGPDCQMLETNLRNPFFVGDDPALTQTSGWAGAWASSPSVYAIAAETSADIAAAVNFARQHRLRLVVKGGGHSYQGTSNSKDSLLVWTRAMRRIELHEAFLPAGSIGTDARPAVSLGAGTLWVDAYDAVTTKANRYVQGGGCTSVGVAGLIQSGGFGSFSKRYGLAAASLLEAEIVTADGQVRIVNAFQNPDLFWALKGGGGGTFGIVSRLTLATHPLLEWFGGAFCKVKAHTDDAYRRLIGAFIAHYSTSLMNPNWGETARFAPDSTLDIGMVFQGLDQRAAEKAWAPFVQWLELNGDDLTIERPFQVIALPARHLWNRAWLSKHAPSLIVPDDRASAPERNFSWAGDARQVGQLVHAYSSVWLPASLLDPSNRGALTDATFRASRHWPFAWHFNKGLAGADPDTVRASRAVATNPDVLAAFALMIAGAEAPAAFPAYFGTGVDLAAANSDARRLHAAMAELRQLSPDAGSYVAEADYFEDSWQDRFWGANYQRLLKVKQTYDPEGLFFVHHGVGSEGWTADGFERV